MASNETPADPRRILITGANRGLGYELTRMFVEGGDIVWAAGRPDRTGRVRELQPAGVVEMDMAEEGTIASAIAELAKGIDGLDLLINCAGIDARAVGGSTDARGPFDLDAATFTAVSVVNATGPMVVTKEALGLLRQGQNPLILNISSQLGSMQVAADLGNDTAYCVSKAALNMLSVKTAAALKPEGIGVVMLHPGWVSTDMGGPSASLTPQQSAAAIHETVGTLSLEDTGRFINWDGTSHAW